MKAWLLSEFLARDSGGNCNLTGILYGVQAISLPSCCEQWMDNFSPKVVHSLYWNHNPFALKCHVCWVLETTKPTFVEAEFRPFTRVRRPCVD